MCQQREPGKLLSVWKRHDFLFVALWEAKKLEKLETKEDTEKISVRGCKSCRSLSLSFSLTHAHTGRWRKRDLVDAAKRQQVLLKMESHSLVHGITNGVVRHPDGLHGGWSIDATPAAAALIPQRTHAHTHVHAHTRARARAHTHTHTHLQHPGACTDSSMKPYLCRGCE